LVLPEPELALEQVEAAEVLARSQVLVAALERAEAAVQVRRQALALVPAGFAASAEITAREALGKLAPVLIALAQVEVVLDTLALEPAGSSSVPVATAWLLLAQTA
jgi:hypothetical protein